MGIAAPEAEAYDAWAEYYDVADANREPFIRFYSGLLGPGTRSLLDLGCGTGSILAALAEVLETRHGQISARVAGVDASAGMLRVAAARHPGIEWIYGDIRHPPVEGRFDLVTCCFNTLQHLLEDGDLDSAMRAAARLLSPGGRFAFDIYQPNLTYISVPAHDRLARSLVDASGRSLEIREESSYNPARRLLTIDWRLVRKGNRSGEPPLATTRYRLRQHFPADLERALASAGLAIAERYGDFDRSPFNAASLRQVLVCTAA